MGDDKSERGVMEEALRLRCEQLIWDLGDSLKMEQAEATLPNILKRVGRGSGGSGGM